MNNNKYPWYCSWAAIIIAFFFFWPVGIVLLILRNSQDKKSAFLGASNQKTYKIIGIVLIVFGVLGFTDDAAVGLFIIIGGIALIVYARKLAKQAERNRTYIDLVVNQGETSLDKIANICNIQYEEAVKELTKLVKVGVLKNAQIDENARTITIPRAVPVQEDAYAPNTASAQGAQSERVTCTCPGCGAKVALVRGTTINCEYCDAPIVAK